MVTIAQAGEEPKEAYLLLGGDASLVLPENTELSFKISKEKSVLGVPEVLLAKEQQIPLSRQFTIIGDNNTKLMAISPNKLLQLINSFNAGFSISRDLAKQHIWLSNLITEKTKLLSSDERRNKAYCVTLAWITNTLRDEYDKKRFGWLEDLYKPLISTLEYQKGQSYNASDNVPGIDVDTESLDDFTKSYPPGAIICKQGDVGAEMYVLVAGKIAIEIMGEQVASIDEPGACIGELALLLGQKRSATMRSVHNTMLTVIHRSNLKGVCEAQKDFMKNITLTLARRVSSATTTLATILETLKSTENETKIPSALKEDKAREILKETRQNLKQYYDQYNMEWLYDLYVDVGEKMAEARKL
jgi:CRP-like cAMP-binding protein